jgi:deoxyadenosine/deoxycytidine kinase
MKNLVYAIEGNIACGKSTILNNLSKLYPNKIESIQEQVKDWHDSNLLQLYYILTN